MGFQLGAAFLGTIASFKDECISTGCALQECRGPAAHANTGESGDPSAWIWPLKEFSGCREEEGTGLKSRQVCILPLLGCAWAGLIAAELLALYEAWMKGSVQSVVVCGVI